jgi:tRNA(Ile2) C34 agmatinyltransferase TiaS
MKIKRRLSLEDKFKDADFYCCGQEMEPVGLRDCNGWRCNKCGREIPDVASFKLTAKEKA